jgi:acetyl esterase/lipase
MQTHPLVDPELLPLALGFPPVTYSMANLPAIRQQFEMLLAMMPPVPDNGVRVYQHQAPGPVGAPPVRVVLYMPPGAARLRPALLHLHGGGYVLGQPESSDAKLKSLAAELDIVIASVDYRLPPEAPHPAPVEDAYAALCWLYMQAAELGVDRGRIAVGGESAGGGLAAALALVARDRAEVPVCFQWLIYPMLDDRTCVQEDSNLCTGEFIWTREANIFGWSALLGGAPGGDAISAYAAPARADSVVNLPPAFIAVGALDLFLDEDVAFASHLLRAGVPVELHVYPGAFHGFDMVVQADVSRRFERDSRAALRRALG